MDYLAAETPTLDRLKSKVSLVTDLNIMKTADLAGVIEKQQITPAVYLIYAGDRISGSDDGRSEDGDEQVVAQHWMAVVAVKHAKGGEQAHAKAGPIISEVLHAISGWRPADGYTSFIRINGPRPGYRKNFGYFPLLFSTNLVTE